MFTLDDLGARGCGKVWPRTPVTYHAYRGVNCNRLTLSTPAFPLPYHNVMFWAIVPIVAKGYVCVEFVVHAAH